MRGSFLIEGCWTHLRSGLTVAGVLIAAMTPSAAKAGDGAPQAAATTGWATSVSFEPFAAAEGGYDSNPDQRRQGRGSWYEMLQAGTRATWQRTDTEVYTGYARGRYYSFQDIDHPNRYDIDLALGARYDLSPAWVLKLGSSFYRDAVSLQSADLFRSFVELVHEGQDYQVRVNAHSHTELSLHNPPLPPGLAVDVFDTTRNNAFDYTKNGATLSLLTFRNAAVSPYLIASLADVYYMNQSPNALLDRSADDMWASLGLRLKLASTLTFDIGGRVNHRAFEQADANDFTRGFLDARLTWYATPALAFRGIVERQIKEPSTPFGLADDVTTYEVSAQHTFGPWAWFVRAYLDQVRPIGEHLTFDKYNWSTGVSYQLQPNVELYANYTGKYVLEQVHEEAYTRHQIGAGVRAKF